MAISQYTVGTEVQLNATFTVNGTPTDPTTVTCRVKDPNSNLTVYTSGQISHNGVGLFSVDIYLNTVGNWWYRWEGTGSATVAAENQIKVQITHF